MGREGSSGHIGAAQPALERENPVRNGEGAVHRVQGGPCRAANPPLRARHRAPLRAMQRFSAAFRLRTPGLWLKMHLARRATVIACVIFAGALIGNALQWLLPAHHLADAKATIGMVQGLVTLLLALVLGLLVWTSYGVYAQQLAEAHTLGSQILQLVVALDRYGPDAAGGRELVRKELEDTRERFWGRGEGGAAS